MIDKDRMYKHILGSIPPKLPTRAVAKILGVTRPYASQLCKKHGYEILRVSEIRRIQIESLPDSLSVQAVAKIVGVSERHAQRLIDECDYKTGTAQHRGTEPVIDWDAVDWSKQNATIAEELGCTRERVRQVRKARGIKPSDQHYARRSSQINIDWIKEHADWCREHRVEVVGQAMPCVVKSPQNIRALLRRAGVEPKLAKVESVPWDRIDWRLPTKTLAEIWRRPAQAFSSRRNRHDLPAPKWRRGRDKDDPQHIEAIQAQRNLAAYWRHQYSHLAENGDDEQ